MTLLVTVFLVLCLEVFLVLCQNSTNETITNGSDSPTDDAHSVIFTGVVIATATILARIVN